ncbi:hypothetical protein UPYG_G00018620 [Umbra pygmaea]|uniref:glycogenin glucosyltransferase n=1 Tax=Umbra pygmaea TaxID=75934 RepID=A0ABD0Y9C1_UMBPY
MPAAADQAYVTLATTDSYCMGALVVGQCLRRHGTTRHTVVMVSPNVSRQARAALGQVFDHVLVVDVLDSGDWAHLYWLGRPELGVTFTKIHCWTLTQYRKCVFLDADILVLCNVDELFEREELSAAPDPGWPDCFNSGVFVFRPSLDTHARLLEHARYHGSFDGGDQGLLNTFFSDWAVKDIKKHLPFVYNLSANTMYTYLPAYQQYGHNAKIVHFVGLVKPWNLCSASQTSLPINSQLEEFVYQCPSQQQSPGCGERPKGTEDRALLIDDFTEPLLREVTLGTDQRPDPPRQLRETHTKPEDVSTVKDGGAKHNAPGPIEEHEPERRWLWEEGHIDYLGKDSFDNIQKKLDRFLD